MSNYRNQGRRESRQVQEDSVKASQVQPEKETDIETETIGMQDLVDSINTLEERLNSNPVIGLFELSAKFNKLEKKLKSLNTRTERRYEDAQDRMEKF